MAFLQKNFFFLASFIPSFYFDFSDHREMETGDKIPMMLVALQLCPATLLFRRRFFYPHGSDLEMAFGNASPKSASDESHMI